MSRLAECIHNDYILVIFGFPVFSTLIVTDEDCSGRGSCALNCNKINTMGATRGAGNISLPEHMSSPGFREVRVAR
jgi:hypothetical protein